jgi:threonine synthase
VERRSDLWRYEEVLPVRDASQRIALGEGWTPLIHAEDLGRRYGTPGLLIKDEAQNPTGSFKARGLCMAISRARELGLTAVAIPTAGNAGSAAAAYAAAAGMTCHVFMPADCPQVFEIEARAYGARVERVDGLIDDCGRRVREGIEQYGWFDLSTLKEPYRVEGKKTMGYELAEQLGWRLPEVVIYPTGGGTGLIGMWKAFEEMEEMGLIDPGQRPRMVSVQAEGCCPIVRAFEAGEEHAERFEGAATIADGLRVPVAVADFLMLRAIRASGGTALSVTDAEMLDYSRVMAARTGVFPAPEGGATLAAFAKLRDSGWILDDESVVLFNTGTPLKVMNLWA